MNNENVKIMEKLINKLNEASDAYYNGKDEIMSNYEWDTMFDSLHSLRKRQGLFCRIPQHKKLVQMRLAEMALRKSNMSFRHCRLIRQRILTNFQKSFLSLGMESVTSCGNLTVVL